MHDRHALPGTDVLADGIRLHVVEYGSGEPLLLLHGLPTTSYLWHNVARDLAHSHRCLMPDLVGLGASEAPADTSAYGLARQARVVLAMLDTLGVERIAVAGHDIGGTVAVHLAALAPERVTALALLTPLLHADVWPVASAVPWLLPGVGRLAVAGLRRSPVLGALAFRRAMDPALTDAECEHFLAPLRTPEGGRGLLRVFRAIDVVPVEAQLALIAGLPTLVLWGEEDPIHSVAYGRRVAAAIPGSTWVPVAGGGHLLPLRAPQRVAEELHAFLTEPAPLPGG